MDKIVIKKWLREQLVRLVNVQRCGLGQHGMAGAPIRDADLVVYTWTGILIHIHLLDEPIKPNKIQRILESATSVGAAVLFLVDARLLPRPGERTTADKWFVPLQDLASDRIYTYRIGVDSPILRPAQFVPITKTEVEAVYGDDVNTIEQLRHFRETVKNSALKGYWLVADFEADNPVRNSYVRQTDYSRFQPPPPPQNANGQAGQAHSTNGSAPPEPSSKTRLESYYTLLEVEQTASREEVKAAFRRLAFEVHPDVSELPKDEAEARFKLLVEAYEYIKSANQWSM
jgi:hypothetical protein